MVAGPVRRPIGRRLAAGGLRGHRRSGGGQRGHDLHLGAGRLQGHDRTADGYHGPVPTTTVPAGGTVPSGFDPVSFTAVSPSEYWLLGDAPCSNPVCTSIVRTTDGGSHFVGLPAPASPLLEGQGSSTGINTLRFADDLDGYAFATGSGGRVLGHP